MRVIRASDVQIRPARRWPICGECERPAHSVSASPRWEPDGLHGDGPPARFFCPAHGNDHPWYWMYLIPDIEPNQGATIRDFDFIAHLAAKTWGMAFLSWLLQTYDLADHALPAEYRSPPEGEPT